MDLPVITVWMAGISLVSNFATNIWVYLEKRNDKTNQRITALNEIVERIDKEVVGLQSACQSCPIETLAERLGALEKDVSGLQASAEQAPSHHDLDKVYEAVNDLSEKVDTLAGGFDAFSATLRQILNRIIEKGMP